MNVAREQRITPDDIRERLKKSEADTSKGIHYINREMMSDAVNHMPINTGIFLKSFIKNLSKYDDRIKKTSSFAMQLN